MGKELRAYRIAENVMAKTNNKGNYDEVLAKAREIVSKTRPSWNSHVGDDYSARLIANDILGERIYF